MNTLSTVLKILLCLLVLPACSSTKLMHTWSSPEQPGPYRNIMVMGIFDTEQTRRPYETYFSDHLQDRGIKSLPSYKLVDHKSEMQLSESDKDSFRNIVEKAISGSSVDAVLITHIVFVDEEDVYRPQPGGRVYYATSYYDNMHGYHGYVTSYVGQPGYYARESTYTLETNLYDVKTEDLVWTTRSRSFSAESIDDSVRELAGLIIDDLVSRNIIN